MSVAGLISGSHTLLVGIEDQDDGGLRLYLMDREHYALVYDEEAKAEVRQTWNCSPGHVTVPVPPPEAIFTDAGSQEADPA